MKETISFEKTNKRRLMLAADGVGMFVVGGAVLWTPMAKGSSGEVANLTKSVTLQHSLVPTEIRRNDVARSVKSDEVSVL